MGKVRRAAAGSHCRSTCGCPDCLKSGGAKQGKTCGTTYYSAHRNYDSAVVQPDLGAKPPVGADEQDIHDGRYDRLYQELRQRQQYENART